MNPALDYFSLSLFIIQNKRKSFRDRKVSLLCNKDPKCYAKNNLECGKQYRGTHYPHDTRVTTGSWRGWKFIMQTPGSDGLSLAPTGSCTNTIVSRLHCGKCLPGTTQAPFGILRRITHQFKKAVHAFLYIVND